LKFIAIAENGIRNLWTLVKDTSEGFKDTVVQMVPFTGLLFLLTLNTILLLRNGKANN